MALIYHKAITDAGGSIGAEIMSGEVNVLFSEILLSEQASGVTISRKFYIKNDGLEDVNISNFSMDSYEVFVSILFESSGDAQVEGDLTGSEVDESPMNVTIPAGGHKSFWVQLDVPASSTKTDNYGNVNVKTIKG